MNRYSFNTWIPQTERYGYYRLPIREDYRCKKYKDLPPLNCKKCKDQWDVSTSSRCYYDCFDECGMRMDGFHLCAAKSYNKNEICW